MPSAIVRQHLENWIDPTVVAFLDLRGAVQGVIVFAIENLNSGAPRRLGLEIIINYLLF